MMETKWISVDERLPEKGEVVQFFHIVWKCPVSASIVDVDDHRGSIVREKTKTTEWPIQAFSHWMPLPKPP